MPTNHDTIDEYAKQVRRLRREITQRGLENLRHDLLDRVRRYDGPARTATDAWWEEVIGPEYFMLRRHGSMRLLYDYVTAFALLQELKQAYQTLAAEKHRAALRRWQAREYVKKIPSVIGVVAGVYTLVNALVPDTPASPRAPSSLPRFTNRGYVRGSGRQDRKSSGV